MRVSVPGSTLVSTRQETVITGSCSKRARLVASGGDETSSKEHTNQESQLVWAEKTAGRLEEASLAHKSLGSAWDEIGEAARGFNGEPVLLFAPLDLAVAGRSRVSFVDAPRRGLRLVTVKKEVGAAVGMIHDTNPATTLAEGTLCNAGAWAGPAIPEVEAAATAVARTTRVRFGRKRL